MSPEESYRQGVDQVLALFSEGRHLEMLQALQPLIETYPTQPALYNLVGAAQMARGRSEPALKFYDRAIQLKPDFAVAHANRGVVLRSLGRLEEALASQDAAIRHQPHFPDAWFHRANILHRLHRLEEALDSFATLIAQQPDHADAHRNRGTSSMSWAGSTTPSKASIRRSRSGPIWSPRTATGRSPSTSSSASTRRRTPIVRRSGSIRRMRKRSAISSF